MDTDREEVLARAHAAGVEATRLERLAREIRAEAAVTCARHQVLVLSPPVEARLHTERAVGKSPLTSPRAVEAEARELYDDLTDWHSTVT